MHSSPSSAYLLKNFFRISTKSEDIFVAMERQKKHFPGRIFPVILFCLCTAFPAWAQVADTSMLGQEVFRNRGKVAASEVFRIAGAGVPLVACGVAVNGENVRFREFRNGIAPSFDCHIDDYLQYAPAAVMVGMKAAGIKSRSSWGRMLVSDAFSAAIMASLVNGLKYSVWEMRPDRSGRNSFPSGHTATAFMTATMFSREYGERSVWYSVGAYSVAATIGLMRIFNDKHWLGDVLAGAGIGILSTEMGYWLADLIFKDKGIRHFPVDGEFSSSYCPSFMGLYLGMNVVLGNRVPGSRRGFSPGSVAGVEGAWFFGPYMGVGSRLTVSGTFFPGQEIAGPVRMNMTSACAGMYFSYPVFPRLLAGGKVMAGYVRSVFPGPSVSDAVPGNSRSVDTFSVGTGISLSFRMRPHLAVRLFADYDMVPFLSGATFSPVAHSITLGGSADVTF